MRAPADGAYRFLIAGDDTALLFVSADGTPAHRRQVALVPAYGGRCDWGRYAAQRSAPIKLEAGQRCFVQAIVKNGDGPGHVEVGWELPGGKVEGPIAAENIETPAGQYGVPAYGRVEATVTLKADQAAATTPGQHHFVQGASADVGGRTIEVSYLIHLPGDYAKSDDSRPLFVFLHGNMHQGHDLRGILNEGPAQNLNEIAALRDWFPMIALFPQLPEGWRWDTPGAGEMTVALIEELCKRYPRIDRDRIYLSGLSMGGKGTWLTAYAKPSLFAVIAPISSVAVRPKAVGQLKGCFTWIICGEHDHLFTQGSREMYAALQAIGSTRANLTVVPNDGHGCWARYYPQRSFYEELMKHRRGK